MSEWISVKDRLPMDHCIVFGRLKGDLAHDFHFARSHNREFWQRDTAEDIEAVHYWLPLPSLPQLPNE